MYTSFNKPFNFLKKFFILDSLGASLFDSIVVELMLEKSVVSEFITEADVIFE